ncbi:Predicted DNA-binding transcriptional regulator YafY, contains an HTH and WYL domains [Selenomonas ruminantium]|uniref:Predicted DNA-binding transcriptional regulator YafY, contains an HTH and WYL domains n=1 Tax=Selenomonas ruminantium TaxID=971 RepID=A0A1M6TPL3_SELRU|nr:WYL domain-containing protein [Selenomonas ruminantium]SHK58877.1 Predicted DNA-binding transcriptional regulator YafY, contains an HTH and WYL domains [Selenomonas ruminantium]
MKPMLRIVHLFCRLLQRERLNRENVIEEYKINSRTFDRDISDIRNVLSELHARDELIYDRNDKCYYLSRGGLQDFTGMDVMAILKVLLGSRALCHDEMMGMVDAIRSLLPYEDRKALYYAIEDELKNYIEPMHGKAILELQWRINKSIIDKQKIQIIYTKADGKRIERDVLPVNIVFAEFYFYLVAFRDESEYEYPAFFRLDRIESIKVLGKVGENPLYTNFRYSDMRPAVQFMYAGELLEIKLRCKKSALEAVVDRVPKYEIIQEKDESVLLKVTAFGEGFIRWAAMQGESVEILAPQELRQRMGQWFTKVAEIYMQEVKEK